jgi:NAD(P)-dependent dehydrogenase (short-subunit alcohol dehydrogenase family)
MVHNNPRKTKRGESDMNPNPSSSDPIDGGEISTGGEARRATSGGKLAGKVAVITGGTSGIGLATARLFAAEGARVLATGTSEDSVAAARKQLGPGVQVVRSDAADPAEVRALFENVGRSFGALDVLFINAGIVRNAPLTALDDAVFDEVMRVNVRGPFLALKHAAPLLRAGSAVVVNTSVANRLGVPNAGAYSASKAAARALVRTAAAELVERGVRVNAICPGPTNTPVYHRQGLPPELVPQVIQHLTSLVPQRRLADPAEIARAVLFLACDDSSFITGEELVAAGGLSAL